MNYEQFITDLLDRVAVLLGDSVQIDTHTALKNNNHKRIGIHFMDNHSIFSPIIYMEEYYTLYCQGESLNEIAQNIVQIYQEVQIREDWQVESIKYFESIQSKIMYKLISTERNAEFLEGVPSIPYLDLSIVFYILFETDDSGISTIPITNQLLDFWDTNAAALYQLARKNTPTSLPASLKSMHTVIEELLEVDSKEELPEKDVLFVLTNHLRNLGAICILYPNMLEHIATQLGENFYVLPSSIHETILIPESESPGRERLLEMVKEVNLTEVTVEDILSDKVYYYDSKLQCLS